jgi:hypothetical protein
MKPEVSAPGVNIYSAVPGGEYQVLSGTSMAGPHVAGVVALMRAANPDLDVETVKQIIMDTCTDLGAAGEDNAYGHGFINAYEAVLASTATGVAEVAVPLAFELAAPQPNPFGDRVSISYAVPVEGVRVSIRVFDVAGRLVRMLVDAPGVLGRHSLEWDGRDQGGRRITSGVYFYRMNAGSFEQVQKVTMLR